MEKSIADIYFEKCKEYKDNSHIQNAYMEVVWAGDEVGDDVQKIYAILLQRLEEYRKLSIERTHEPMKVFYKEKAEMLEQVILQFVLDYDVEIEGK